jgi:hypothetical protein
MTSEELCHIDAELRPLSISVECCDDAHAAVGRFNARIEHERTRLHDARASLDGTGSLPLDLEVVLRAAAVMFKVERERIAQRFRFVPLTVRVP